MVGKEALVFTEIIKFCLLKYLLMLLIFLITYFIGHNACSESGAFINQPRTRMNISVLSKFQESHDWPAKNLSSLFTIQSRPCHLLLRML